MAKKNLWIGNLSYRATKQDLVDAFEHEGFRVEETELITDPETKRSKGYAFMRLRNPDEAEDAISVMHEHEIQGRKIIVDSAHPKRPKQETADAQAVR